MTLGVKRCNKCEQSKPIDEFHRNRNNPDGLSYHCKPCRRKYDAPRNPKPNATHNPPSALPDIVARGALPTLLPSMSLDEMLRDLIQIGAGEIVYRATRTVYSRDATSPTLDLWRSSLKRQWVDVLAWKPGEPEFYTTLGRSAYNVLWAVPVPSDHPGRIVSPDNHPALLDVSAFDPNRPERPMLPMNTAKPRKRMGATGTGAAPPLPGGLVAPDPG